MSRSEEDQETETWQTSQSFALSFDEPTNTVSYLVADPATKAAAVIDPVLDYDHNAGEGRHTVRRGDPESGSRGRLQDCLDARDGCTPTRTTCQGLPTLRRRQAAQIGIGEHIKQVQRIFRPIFNANDLKTDGSDFDHLFTVMGSGS